jgi:hypothetical protein
MPRAVDPHTFFRGEKEGNNSIGKHENKNIDDHQADLRILDLRQPKNGKGKEHHGKYDANIIRKHHRKCQQ